MATIDSGSETSQTMRVTFESRPSMPVASEAAFRTAFSFDSLRPRTKNWLTGRPQGQFGEKIDVYHKTSFVLNTAEALKCLTFFSLGLFALKSFVN